jgi:PAS domain S-box-containing protein
MCRRVRHAGRATRWTGQRGSRPGFPFLRAYFDNIVALSEDAIISLDAAQRIRLFNRGAEAIFGYTAEEMLGQRLDILLPARFHAIHRMYVTHFAGSSEALRAMNDRRPIVAVRKDGTEFPAEATITKFAVNGQTILTVRLRDITERTRAEEDLRQSRDELEQRVKERTAELSGAIQTLEHQSAQLRQLATELTLAEQRERRRLASLLHDEHQQLLAAANLRVSRLTRMGDPRVQEACGEIADLLTEAIDSARSLSRDLSPPILPGSGLVRSLEWLAQWMEEKHGLRVALQASGDPVPATEGIATLLFQGIRELLFNIVKHAQVSDARVEIGQTGDRVQIVVSDVGVGFDAASLLRSSAPSAGFGLFSIRNRLELLAGHLKIESTPGRGSRFTLSAPLRHSEDGQPQSPTPREPHSAAGTPAPPGRDRRMRILLADDHAVVRQALAMMLTQEQDIEVIGEAANGKQAVEMAGRLQPDVVLMDINMPVMNGIQATQQIRGSHAGIQVIGLSMFEDSEQANAMREVGAAGYVSKGASPDALLDTIRTCRTMPPKAA